MGHQGLGCTWVDPYRCQDAFPGLVGPFWATGGRFGAIFHISGFPIFVRIIFPIFPIIPGVAGLLFTGGRTAKKEGGSDPEKRFDQGFFMLEAEACTSKESRCDA